MPILYSTYAILNSLTYQKLNSFPSINIIISNLLLVIYSIYFLKHLIDLDPFQTLLKNPLFWFNTAVLVYFTLQIFIWGIMNYLIRNKKNVDIILIFGVCVSIFYYAFLGLSIVLDNKRVFKKE